MYFLNTNKSQAKKSSTFFKRENFPKLKDRKKRRIIKNCVVLLFSVEKKIHMNRL